MINTKRPGTDDYTQVGFLEAKDGQGNYQNIDHIYDSEGNIVFQQGYLNEYDGANDFRIPAIGKPLIDYTIYGNTFQDGIPTLDTPIMPRGTGERTGNLVRFYQEEMQGTFYGVDITVKNAEITLNGTVSTGSEHWVEIGYKFDGGTEYRDDVVIPCESETSYTIAIEILDGNSSEIRTITFGVYDKNKTINIGSSLTTTFDGDINRIFISLGAGGVVFNNLKIRIMFNKGSTALPYEPYGYKIPISSANTTTPVYLGEVEITRKIRKVVFNGTEPWVLSGTIVYINNTDTEKLSPLICTHFPNVTNTGMWNGNNWVFQVNISRLGMSGREAWITWLAEQYAAGTPVTVWYVLAKPTTGIVNEPLMRIGDYADSVDFSQAGVEIPTLKRPNTTEIDITTSLPPSEVYAKYRGSKTQKYDLFLAANGDSFEAKNGQSLYIGDDT